MRPVDISNRERDLLDKFAGGPKIGGDIAAEHRWRGAGILTSLNMLELKGLLVTEPAEGGHRRYFLTDLGSASLEYALDRKRRRDASRSRFGRWLARTWARLNPWAPRPAKPHRQTSCRQRLPDEDSE